MTDTVFSTFGPTTSRHKFVQIICLLTVKVILYSSAGVAALG